MCKHSRIHALVLLLLLSILQMRSHCKTSSKTIFSDNFDRSTGMGSNYTLNLPSGSSFTISENSAWPSAAGTAFSTLPAAIYNQQVNGSFKVSATFSIAGGTFTNMGFIFARSTSADTAANSYVCGYYYDSTALQYYFMLGKVTSGTLAVMGQIDMHTLSDGISDTITFTMNQSSLNCAMTGNDTIAISVADSTYGDGYFGLIGGGLNTNYLYFDNLDAEEL